MATKKLLYRIALFLWIGGLAFLALASHSLLRGNVIVSCCHNDFKHLIGAFVLAILAYQSFQLPSFKITISAWSILSVSFELIQQIVTNGNRSFEIIDIFYNIAGFLLGAALFHFLMKQKNSTTTH